MTVSIKRAAAGLALVGLAHGGVAQAACWNENAIEAAHVRTLETMLMVAALRCRDTGVDLLGNYNAFVRASRPTLTAMNDRLRSHFGSLNSYDRYVTSIANRYGGGGLGLNCDGMARVLDAAQAAGGSARELAEIAYKLRISVELPGTLCTVTMAHAD